MKREKKEILDHFQAILGSKVTRSRTFNWEQLNLSKIDTPELDVQFTEEEILHAINEQAVDKASGPDGFTNAFYKTCWPVIKNDLIQAINCLFRLQAGPLQKLNSATVVLLPKKENSQSIKDFRPISLIHSFAKLITKILAMRLAKHMDSLISNSQSAFIKRRCIQDNFLYVRNLARAYQRTRTPALVFKLDITKAFDTVSWEYILELLEQRGFRCRWRNWISLLLASSTSSVLLNGIPGPPIQHKRGLR